MDKFATENLILLEFLVDQVNLNFDVQREILNIAGETCVSFQFLDNAPLLVCEQDFTTRKLPCDQNVKNGKSCLFSLTPAQAEECVQRFDIFVEVFRRMRAGILPNRFPIGQSLISITSLFVELIESMSGYENDSPTAKTLKDTFTVSDSRGNQIGTIDIYVRMSCFGKLIVTQFQMNLADKSVQFKAKEGHYLFKYKKGKQSGENWQRPPYRGTCSDQLQEKELPCPLTPCAPIPQEIQPPCEPPRMSSPYCVPPPIQQISTNVPCSVPQNEENAQASMPDGPGTYQEIGAVMGGNALTIRVHKDLTKVDDVSDATYTDDQPCSCTVENFGKAKKKLPPPPPPQLPPCAQNTQQALAMRPGVADDGSPFNFRLNGKGQTGNDVFVSPPTCTTKDGTAFTEISDPTKDVFILRIGKKSEGVGKTNNLELELCTPKPKEVKPPPVKETRDTQYEADDVPVEVSKKKGKGKKEKGDKKSEKKGKGKAKGNKK